MATSPITGISEKSRAFVTDSVLPLGFGSERLGARLRNVRAVKPESSSTRLSPPNANSAKLPAMSPVQTEPMTSTVIHAELKYSTLMPAPILVLLQDWWVVLQQQEAQP